ncbi:hypothetical protein chiPu_0007409 [Chiloscyllium punctatum]|uniref:Uncharacterized protein n=1 Tax=Chiloscyllium punctatum TaxID=137246 RepID=A0A401SF43_CHIPU|nr:hypothetical protein [Chiloscyllium punctatum]
MFLCPLSPDQKTLQIDCTAAFSGLVLEVFITNAESGGQTINEALTVYLLVTNVLGLLRFPHIGSSIRKHYVRTLIEVHYCIVL